MLNPGALLDYELNTPGVVGGATNDLTVVNGALTLDGVLNITGAFAPGTYRLMNYTGALTDNTLDVRDGAGRRAARDRSVRADVGGQSGESDQLVRAGADGLGRWQHGAARQRRGRWGDRRLDRDGGSQLDAGRRRDQRAVESRRGGDLPGHRRHGDGRQHQWRGDLQRRDVRGRWLHDHRAAVDDDHGGDADQRRRRG